MGAHLICSSEFVRQRLRDLEESLASLPAGDQPKWNLTEQILAGKETSRIAEAALSQPLCTAIQIVLVDLLRTARINFTTVVGHSSGEIGAAVCVASILFTPLIVTSQAQSASKFSEAIKLTMCFRSMRRVSFPPRMLSVWPTTEGYTHTWQMVEVARRVPCLQLEPLGRMHTSS